MCTLDCILHFKNIPSSCTVFWQYHQCGRIYQSNLCLTHIHIFLAHYLKWTLFPPAVHTQNAAFGTTPSFDWLTKYRNKVGSSNPFAEDVFDPMKYMNLEGPNNHVTLTEEGLCSTNKIFLKKNNSAFVRKMFKIWRFYFLF